VWLFNSSRPSERAAVLSALLVTPLLWGCGQQKQQWETTYPAKGLVTYKGVPIANAEIALFPQDDTVPETVRPRAITSEDGEFVVWTYEKGDGAPAGNYKATVVHHEVVESKGVMATKPNDLPRKYATVQSTDLLVEIGEGETEIPPFELQ
jgi:hypothetical protein